MADYVVSARKYRPDSFDSVIGQGNIARTLKNSIKRGTIAHAYLFCGPRGVGKTSTARIFAKAINCLNPTEDMEPCGECESCISFREGRSFCIHELDAASNNGVDDIKALLEQVQIPPQVGRYGVFIIDEVHMLSQSAFNAFLKTLEEPPAHAIFILATTEKHKILPTILSRCQTYDFNRISVPDIIRNLRGIASAEGVEIDDDSLNVIARKADGAMRDALTIFDQTVAFCGNKVKYEDVIDNLGVIDSRCCFSLVDAFLAKDYGAALRIFDGILAKGFNALHFVGSLSSHLRDLAVCKTSGADSLLDLPDSLKPQYHEQAEKCSLKFIYDALTATTQCEAGYKASVNPRLHIEYCLMKLSFLQGVPDSRSSETVADTAPKQDARTENPAKNTDGGMPDTDRTRQEDQPAAVPKVAAIPKNAAAGLSLSSFLSAPETQLQDISKTADAVDEELPSDDAIRNGWDALVAKQQRPRLANALGNAKLLFEEQDGKKCITFEVTNEAQKEWIEVNLLRTLEEDLQRITGSSRLSLRVKASEMEETDVVYLPEDKAKVLMQENDEVKNLVIDLELEV